ncbi:UPF0348 protein [Clostridia bacterium]|nr:UPF0348 protein [Clostridia bacterium]
MVCEYNPFHNGHAYHLNETRARTGAEFVVCVMSGAFTQRGIPAVLNAPSRARMALMSGADVVFELPTLFTVRGAQAFASGGVSLLNSLNVCDYLAFGCEDINALEAACHSDESDPDTSRRIREGLNRGESFARARGLPNQPNLILGVEYRRALSNLASHMTPTPIPRAPYTAGPPAITSASELRGLLPHIAALRPFMPDSAYQILRDEPNALRYTANLDAFLLGKLRTSGLETLRQTADIVEGLEYRAIRASLDATSREDCVMRMKCKRYTYTRLSRIIIQSALGITKALAYAFPNPEYARLLGFRESARPLMRLIRERSAIPIVHKAAQLRDNPIFQLDLRSESVAALASASSEYRAGDGALTPNVVIIQ